MSGRLLLPDSALQRDPNAVQSIEKHRGELLTAIQKFLGEMTLSTENLGATNVRNALAATLPGQVAIGEALSLALMASAKVCGSFIDALEASPSIAADEGRRQACVTAFDELLRAVQGQLAVERARKQFKANGVTA